MNIKEMQFPMRIGLRVFTRALLKLEVGATGFCLLCWLGLFGVTIPLSSTVVLREGFLLFNC